MLLTFGMVLLVFPVGVLAADENVNLQVNVLPRKSSDTMNDFNLDSLQSPTGRVLGASAQASAGGSLLSFGQKIWNYLLANTPATCLEKVLRQRFFDV